MKKTLRNINLVFNRLSHRRELLTEHEHRVFRLALTNSYHLNGENRWRISDDHWEILVRAFEREGK